MSQRSSLHSFLLPTLVLSLCSGLQAGRGGAGPAATRPSTEGLSAADRAAIVEKLAAGLEEEYVLEEKGRELAVQLRRMEAAGRFTENEPTELAETLERTLRELSDDLHFRVAHRGAAEFLGAPSRRIVRVPGAGADDTAAPAAPGSEPTAAGPKRQTRMVRLGGAGEASGLFAEIASRFPDNYRTKILPGNIGLLEIDVLFPPNDRLGEAMRDLADTEALIVDIRSCPGGTNLTALPFESAFFKGGVHLRTMADRTLGPQIIESVEATPGGVKYLDRPVYLLVSGATGSACEEVAWTLKYHDKAILVGETTAGAGHGITGTLDLGHDLTAMIPSIRPIHPRFEGGWEGVGVPPDVTIAARRAAGDAHLMALMALRQDAEGEKLRELESLYGEVAMEIGRREGKYIERGRSLRSYAASFADGHRLHVKDGELYYTAEGRTSGPLVPMDGDEHFRVRRGMRELELRVERGAEGEVRSLGIRAANAAEWKRFERVPVL